MCPNTRWPWLISYLGIRSTSSWTLSMHLQIEMVSFLSDCWGTSLGPLERTPPRRRCRTWSMRWTRMLRGLWGFLIFFTGWLQRYFYKFVTRLPVSLRIALINMYVPIQWPTSVNHRLNVEKYILDKTFWFYFFTKVKKNKNF